MRRIIIVSAPIIILALIFQPAINFLNRQRPLEPDNITKTSVTVENTGYFHGQTFTYVSAEDDLSENILGSKSEKKKEKRIEIDLTRQKLYAYSGNKKVYSFSVSTGKWGRTPTGEFRIWIKLASTLMTGGSKALNTYYYLPNVPYTMYFYNDKIPKQRGYGIHGAYWHNNFGHPMSHGCVNMKPDDAKTLYNWSSAETKDNTGTRIIIYGTAPTS